MGNSIGSESSPMTSSAHPALINRFFSGSAWIEGAALDQLDEMSRLPGVLEIAAFPDLHPGKYGATGVALLSSRLHPLLIGNDIGCGMSLFGLDFPLRKLKIDRAAERLRRLEAQAIGDVSELLAEAGLPVDLSSGALGTIGGGNHFCELQAVEGLTDGGRAAGLDDQGLYLLVHSGSRALGATVFSETVAAHSGLTAGLDPGSETGAAWLASHDRCVAWASLNRRLIAVRAAAALRTDLRLIADVPHNLVRPCDRGFAHYKGAAAVAPGELAPIAGSRASLSHVVLATSGVSRSLNGISHGAGRKYDRATMHGRVGRNRSEREQLLRNSWGGIAICDDRALVVEEAASAYKDAGQVVTDLQNEGLIVGLASLRPLVTFKKAVGEAEVEQRRRKPEYRREGGRSHERY
ncbi:RNA ligase RtcB family protein [Rhizobium ruizarguesonis]|uniref:tRNA-splicing ligase RtcB n=2 Tax=Rhizobium ruizarguesonis TaxID=2081791 RepID=A0AB38I889_9HYPH|nr:RNA ligase RtcB family protein [Rhizobium ruizarguesonis]NEI30739.1 RNA ligase RtcB family protein [Rhizobium ruizarguesonis]TAY95292.1 RNA ligase RtcB family protein [Rhizobium ruizarguesonis]TAZ79691.1 RNA ligase RtcB family protein [Rhizobium ruizarguesonis]TBA06070.1 RNA ligase RtcB family protein [Rhizobium ruizarguesonis]